MYLSSYFTFSDAPQSLHWLPPAFHRITKKVVHYMPPLWTKPRTHLSAAPLALSIHLAVDPWIFLTQGSSPPRYLPQSQLQAILLLEEHIFAEGIDMRLNCLHIYIQYSFSSIYVFRCNAIWKLCRAIGKMSLLRKCYMNEM